MNLFPVKLFCLISVGLTTLAMAATQYTGSSHTGDQAIPNTKLWETALNKNTSGKPPATSEQQIARILKIASQMEYVTDVMAVKEAGLVYVRNLTDLEYLTSYTVTNPSDSYIAATGEFIAKYVGVYIVSRADIPPLLRLTSRVQNVNQAMDCKNAGLKIATNVSTFLRILPFGFETPSQEYRSQVSTFIAQNIAKVVGQHSSLETIIQIEKYVTLVTDAMAVKNAGLRAVKTKEDLLTLSTFAFEAPTPAYQQAVREFIRNNIARFPQQNRYNYNRFLHL